MEFVSNKYIKFFKYLEIQGTNEYVIAPDITNYTAFAFKVDLSSIPFARIVKHPQTGYVYLAIPNLFRWDENNKVMRHALSRSFYNDTQLMTLINLPRNQFVPTGLFKRDKEHNYINYEKINYSLSLPVIFGNNNLAHFITMKTDTTEENYDIFQVSPINNSTQEDDTIYFPLYLDEQETHLVIHAYGCDSFRIFHEIYVKNVVSNTPKFISVNADSWNEFESVTSFLMNPFIEIQPKYHVLHDLIYYNKAADGSFKLTPVVPSGTRIINRHDVWTVLRSSTKTNVSDFLKILFNEKDEDGTFHYLFYDFINTQFEEITNHREIFENSNIQLMKQLCSHDLTFVIAPLIFEMLDSYTNMENDENEDEESESIAFNPFDYSNDEEDYNDIDDNIDEDIDEKPHVKWNINELENMN